MKNKILTGGFMPINIFKVALTAGVISTFGCAQKANNSSSTLYSTSFSMSGSAQKTVAIHNSVEKLMSLLMPQATAAIPTNLLDSQNTPVTLDTAWIVIKEIKFKAAETAGEESEDEASEGSEFKGPYFVDLLSAQPQVLDTQAIPAKVYKRIEMKLEAAENDSSLGWPTTAPAGLANKSMYISGTFGSATPFSFSSADGTEFKVSGAGGIQPEEGQNILMSIRFADIIRKIDLSALAGSADKNITDSNRVSATDPCPTIEQGLSDLFTCFRKGLENEADIGKDSDGSGEIESDEDSAKNAE